MPSATDFTLSSTLPAHALLGRLLAVRVALVVGWAAGIAWLHWGLGIRMPLLPMAAVLVLMGAFALSTAWRLRQDVPATQMEFLAHLLADLTAYAVLLYFSGGATNPFVSLMLVPVVIAAISLRPRWTWLLAATASAYYAGLLFVYQPLAVADPLAAYGMHLAGMWFNFLLSAALIAFFVARMHAALRTRERALAELREKQLRDERIVALGTQAALAAHELATPLATLQTTAHDLAAEMKANVLVGVEAGEAIRPRSEAVAIGWKAGLAFAGIALLMVSGYWWQLPGRFAGQNTSQVSILETHPGGLELQNRETALTVLYGRDSGQQALSGGLGSIRADYVDEETGQLTVAHVYAE